MHVKGPVNFRMAPKKSSKGKGVAAEPTREEGWVPSKCSDSNLEILVSNGLLPEKSIIQWRPALGENRPYFHTAEIVAFIPYFERGLGLPCSAFFSGLLHYYRIQLHHLTPDSILHIAIFVHLCEAFLGIYPHFDLFKSLFFLNPWPNFRNVATVGVPILSFILKWWECTFHILHAVRLVTGKPSGLL